MNPRNFDPLEQPKKCRPMQEIRWRGRYDEGNDGFAEANLVGQFGGSGEGIGRRDDDAKGEEGEVDDGECMEERVMMKATLFRRRGRSRDLGWRRRGTTPGEEGGEAEATANGGIDKEGGGLEGGKGGRGRGSEKGDDIGGNGERLRRRQERGDEEKGVVDFW